MTMPDDACDCGIHIYGAAFPTWPGSTAVVRPWADVAAYRAVQQRLGLRRVVVAQPNAYGFDNSCTLAALAAFDSIARGTVAIGPTVTEAELQRLHQAGVRGARFHMLPGGILSWDDLETVAARIAPLGWHIQLQMDGWLLPEREALLGRLPCRVLIDNVGKFLRPVAPDHPGVRSLLRLLEAGHCWLKLSGAYEVSESGPPGYEDVAAIARLALRTAPERMVWASNWPHVGTTTPPEDSALLQLMADWAADERTLRLVLSANPATLFDFHSA